MKITPESIIGQDNLLKFFDKLAVLSVRRPIGGSYIFLGPEGSGKKTLANLLIAKLLCRAKVDARPCGACAACGQLAAKVHSDVFWLSCEDGKKNIAVDDIRGLLRAVGLSSLVHGYKVAVIDQAEKLSRQSANALLKTLEEPNRKTLIILLAGSLSEIPKTVVSRSQVFALRPMEPDKIYDFLVARGHQRSRAKVLASISLGWPGLAIKLSDEAVLDEHLAIAEIFFEALDKTIPERQAVLDKLLTQDFSAAKILDIWQTVIRDLLLYKLSQTSWLRYGSLLSRRSDRLNFSLRQAVAWHKLVAQAKDYAAANVSHKSVLEAVMINI